jgi:hypothetical protein
MKTFVMLGEIIITVSAAHEFGEVDEMSNILVVY